MERFPTQGIFFFEPSYSTGISPISEQTQTRAMLRLRTLGGVYLAREDGQPLGGAAGQRRLLALLAILSAAGDSGMSRDRLVALLWPEGDVEKARHALTQSLYHARRTLREETLFLSSGDQLRINPAALASDIMDLEQALATGDSVRAAELYGGPFLDDFFVPGAGDLDQWRLGTSQRLRERMADVFDGLARAAESAGDYETAVRWRRRLVELDPFNTSSARLLMEALEGAGDRAGALRYGQLHETLLASELSLEPDADFRALATRLRTPVAATAIAPPPRVTTVGREREVASPVTVQSAESAVTRETHSYKRALIGAAAVVAVVVTTVSIVRSRMQADAPITRNETVVVAPFRVTGADGSIAFLKEGLVELLSTRLNDDTVAQPVDPGAVLHAWRANKLLEASEVPAPEIVRFARKLGADAVVLGNVVGDSRRLVMTASLLTLPTGATRASASVTGSIDSLPTLVDHLAGKLLATSAGEADRFADRMTPSLAALRAYLSGQASYHSGHYAAAMQQYERALRLDSTFALAAMRLALAADQLNSADQHDRALALAWANRADLTERDLLHLIAFAGPRYPSPSTEAEQLAAWQDAVTLSPDRAEVWTELGERLFYNGALLAVRDADRQAGQALRKALALDPDESTARRLLILLAARGGDTATLQAIATPSAVRDSSGAFSGFLAWRVAIARGDAKELARVRATLPGLDDANLRAIAMASQFDEIGDEDGARALRLRSRRTTSGPEELDNILAQHSAALLHGDATLALDLTEQLEEKQPGSRAHLRLRVLDALYGAGDTVAATRAATLLTPIADGAVSTSASARPLQLADMCVVGQWRLARGSSDGVRRMIAELRAPGVSPRMSVPIGANPQACAELLDAQLAVVTKTADAAARVARLDSLLLAGPAVSDAGAYAPILIARLYQQLGRPTAALDAVRRRPYLSGWPRYQATARLLERQLH